MGMQELSLEEAKSFVARFYAGLEKAVSTTKKSDLFPLDPLDMLYITAENSVNFWLEIYSNIKEKEVAFPDASALRLEFVYVMIECKLLNLPVKSRIKIISLFKYLMENSVKKDIFCEKGNFIEDFKETTNEYLTDKKLHGRLIVALTNLVWSLYGDCYPNLGLQLHGPYEVGAKQFIIREYTNLKFLKYPIRIISKYADKTIEIDGYNHIHSKKSLFGSLIGFQVFLNGKLASPEDIEETIKFSSKEAIKHYQEFDRLPFNEKMEMTFLFRKKSFDRLADSVSVNRPYCEVIDALDILSPKKLPETIIYSDDLNKKYVYSFQEMEFANENIFGSKTKALFHLSKNGFNVPDAIAISKELFDDFITENQIDLFSEDVEGQFLRSEFSDNVINGLKKYLTMLKLPVIVRSSAMNEDGDCLSYAGVYASFPDLISLGEILKSIKLCFSSIFTDKAKAYSNLVGSMSILIQEMVESDKSGVIFTVNPVNKRDEMVIEIQNGSGSQMALENVTPDTYFVDKKIFRIIGTHITQENQIIIDGHVEELWKLAQRIDGFFGVPQDIEFAINKDDEIFVLQSRPITALAN